MLIVAVTGKEKDSILHLAIGEEKCERILGPAGLQGNSTSSFGGLNKQHTISLSGGMK